MKNKDILGLIQNFFSLGSLQVINLILPILILPYMLRVVGFDKYGVIVMASTLVNYFIPLTDFSFKITATRDVAQNRDDLTKLRVIFTKVVWLKSLLLILSFLIIAIIVLCYQPFLREWVIYVLSTFTLLGQVLFPEWFFQGIEKMKYIAIINALIKIISSILVVIFIQVPDDYFFYPLFFSLGYIVAGLAGMTIIVRRYHLKMVKIDKKDIFLSFKENIPIFVNQFVPTLYNNTSTFLLGIFGTNTLVSVYASIKRIIDLIIAGINVISRVVFPFLNRKKGKAFDLYKKYMTILGLMLTLLPIILYKLVFVYLNIDYDGAFYILLILSIGIFFYVLYDIYGLNYFIVNAKDKIVMKNTIRSSLIGVALGAPLILLFGTLGASLSITVSRMFMGGGLYLKYQNLKLEEKT